MSAPGLPDPARNGIRLAQVRHCYSQLPIALAVSMVNGGLLVVVLWEVSDARAVLAWFGLLLAVTLARYHDLRAFRRALAGPSPRVGAWHRRFTLGAGAAGVVWGVAGAVLFHPDSFPHQFLLAFLLGGMLAGAIPLLSALPHAYPAFAVPVVLPITARMVLAGDQIHLVMGLMIAVFGLAMLASSRQMHALFREAQLLRDELSESIEAGHVLERLVRMDALTGIPNRRLFEEQIHKEWRRAEREGGALAVVTADIDHFKEYNDHYGHPAGDRCLVAVAQAMRRALSRPGDVVARIGGEEFAFLLPGTTVEGARSVAEEIRQSVLALDLQHEFSPAGPRVSVSLGVASTTSGAAASPAELQRASDVALYEAKRLGRNRVAVMQA